MIASSAFLLIALMGRLVTGQLTDVVETNSGPVRGGIFETAPNSMPYAAFLGIRYAEAPTGYQRFQPPIPASSWTETFNATTEGSPCVQLGLSTFRSTGSEDCLFVNVFTPVTDFSETPEVLKPVMVWISGLGFIVGSASKNLYQPDYLLEKDVVYVSFNYRLGAFGFLNLNHPNATGNAGLKDQNLALKWIQSNIAKFGGDPKNVTIFGGSAGSVSVGYHLLSKASAGLFHGAISMSGAPLSSWAFHTSAKAQLVAHNLAKCLGIISRDKETLLDTYRKATPEQLVVVAIPNGRMTNFAPSVEDPNITTDPFLTESPYQILSTGNFNKVPGIIGFMEQENLAFSVRLPMFAEIIEESLENAQDIGIPPPKSLTVTRDLILSGGNLSQLDRTTVETTINITSAVCSFAPIDRSQRFLTACNEGKPVYYYHMSFYTEKSPYIFPGAAHGDTEKYLFYNPTMAKTNDSSDPVSRTISRLTTMWTNFARYGNPTPDWIEDSSVGVRWPDSTASGCALDIGQELTVGPRPIDEDTEYFELLSWPKNKNNWAIPSHCRRWGGC